MRDKGKSHMSVEIEFSGDSLGAKQLHLRIENELRKTNLPRAYGPEIVQSRFQERPGGRWRTIEISGRPTSPKALNSPIHSHDINSLEIEELDLSTKTFRILKRANMLLVGDLLEWTRDELRARVFGLGDKGLEEIELALGAQGARLKE